MARTQRFDSVRHDWKPKGSSTKNKLMVAGLFVFTVGTYVFTMARVRQLVLLSISLRFLYFLCHRIEKTHCKT